jgi:glycine cleavage system H protein
MKFSETVLYTPQHMWAQQQDDGSWLAGITDYAQDMLGDVVFIDPPKVGDKLHAGKPCGLIESVKTGSDLHAPLDGEVIAINDALLNTPEEVNDKPYKSWIFKFTRDNNQPQEALLSAETYKRLVNA